MEQGQVLEVCRPVVVGKAPTPWPSSQLCSGADVVSVTFHSVHLPIGIALNLRPCRGVPKSLDVGVGYAIDFSTEEGQSYFGMNRRFNGPGDSYYCVFGCRDQSHLSVGRDVLVVQDVVSV